MSSDEEFCVLIVLLVLVVDEFKLVDCSFLERRFRV